MASKKKKIPSSPDTVSTQYFSADSNSPIILEEERIEKMEIRKIIASTVEKEPKENIQPELCGISLKKLSRTDGNILFQEGEGMEETLENSKMAVSTVVEHCIDGSPVANFKDGDRNIFVTVSQLSTFLSESLIILEAKVIQIEPEMREGFEEEVLVSKCKQCLNLYQWCVAARAEGSRFAPACPKSTCGGKILKNGNFSFRLTLSHGGGISQALLYRDSAELFLGNSANEFIKDCAVRKRTRVILQSLVESDKPHKFALRIVDHKKPFVYALENTRLICSQ